MDAFSQALRAFIVTDPDGSDAPELQSFMDGLYGQWGGLRSVAVAPNNRVSAVAPLAGNEAVLGLYYPDNPEQWPPIRDAIANREAVLIGPVNLVQGGQGFIYRTPVFLEDGQYWGLVSAVVDVDSLASPDLDGSAFALRQSGDTASTVFGGPEAFSGEPAMESVTALGKDWDVAVPVAPTNRSTSTAILLVGALASVLLSALVFLLAGALGREYAMARLMDDLSSQAPGVLFQLRQRPDGTRVVSYASSQVESLLTDPDGDPDDGLAGLEHLVHPDDRDSVREALDASARSSQPWHQRFRVLLPSRTVAWLLADARPRVDRGGDVVWHGWIGDITDDLSDEAALRVSASLFEVTRDGVAILDAQETVTSVNAGLEAITGYSREELIGSSFADTCAALTPADGLADMRRSLDRHGYWRGEITGRRKDGTARTDRAVATAVRDNHARLSHYIVVLDNMNLTRDDSVTGLPSSRLLDEELRQAQEGIAAPRTALIVVGLDQFRRVNDTYGHRVGDQLLQEVAERLATSLPPGCPLVRLRGDEFAFIVTHADNLVDVEAITTAALESLSAPFQLSGHAIRATAAAGISLSPDDAAGAPDMHVHANQAMRAAKSRGGGHHCFFNPEMQAALQERARLVEDLQTALASGQLTMVYQPIVDLRTGVIARAEALMRWHHPLLGDVPPDRFIPLAEDSGIIIDLSDFAFACALDALRVLRTVDAGFQISVNLSPVELHDTNGRHPRRLTDIADSDLPASSLIVEITEGVLISHDPPVDANLDAYRSAGVRFAIDDFGTGYSSLAYLQQLDVHFLKIDRTFVNALAPSGDGLALCQAIIEMAHKMDIHVIAEGVETMAQNALLTESGCDYAQGYFHARPLPLVDLVSLISPIAHAQPPAQPL